MTSRAVQKSDCSAGLESEGERSSRVVVESGAENTRRRQTSTTGALPFWCAEGRVVAKNTISCGISS